MRAFFLSAQGDVAVEVSKASASSLPLQTSGPGTFDAVADALVYDDHARVVSRLEDTTRLLQEFLTMQLVQRTSRDAAKSARTLPFSNHLTGDVSDSFRHTQSHHLSEDPALFERSRRQASRIDGIIVVVNMSASCGRGHSFVPGGDSQHAGQATTEETPARDAGLVRSVRSGGNVCRPCTIAFFKQAADNSACVACARFSSTNSTGAVSEEACVCQQGYRKLNQSELASAADDEARACVSVNQYVSPTAAAEAAAGMSQAVGVAVASNVALAVGTAVASSVSSAVAASSGGAVGGAVGGGVGGSGGLAGGSSGGGMAVTLITQVQFLNQVGALPSLLY